ncbi:MAG: CRTAC1 family protein, partial [Bacteroidetes bacterium]
MPAEKTGIDFINEVQDQAQFNILTYRNFYNGGGVAIGDINNDSLPDLYFTANLTANKLFLNRGNFRFEDITARAGVGGTKAWSTGATMADVNGDGWLDIYVSNSGDVAGADKENELFINQGDGTFVEQAALYGLNNPGYSTQAAFFDYDLDGDLDCYLLNNSFKDPSKIELYHNMRLKPDKLGGDKLYRNDGLPAALGGSGKGFTDVTTQAGIYSSAIGFGLGAAIGDVNMDYLPDIYVSNDFWERDYLYINQGDGTFSEELIQRINLCSIASMGGDIADLNNDGFPEIFSTDMLAGDNFRLQAMTSFDPYHLDDLKYRANYHYQYLQNCLHLNDGRGKFQEIAMLAGVGATDWSWGALIFDFENDGQKDIFVSNGVSKDIMSMDFRDFLADNNVYRLVVKETDYRPFIAKMPAQPLANYAFQPSGKWTYTNRAQQLGLATPSFSNGAAYGDLDNDGDQDLVVNNVNMPAFVYENQAERRTGNHYLKIRFEGYAQNPYGIGAQVDIRAKGQLQSLQNFNSRGFESSIEPLLIFGLGKAQVVDELQVIWPDGSAQQLSKLPANQLLTLRHADATQGVKPPPKTSKAAFAEVSHLLMRGDTRHRENPYNDFDHEPLLLHRLSTEGPRILRADVNGDRLEDVLLLGAAYDEDKLFIQQPNGSFVRRPNAAFRASKDFESSCGAFFDHDGDGDLDLMLGAGGNEYQRDKKYFILRYFRNDGQGNFVVDNRNIPQLVGNFACMEA